MDSGLYVDSRCGSGAKNLAFLQDQCNPSRLGKLINLITGKIVHKDKTRTYAVVGSAYCFLHTL